MNNLLLLFAALSVFSKNTLDQLQKKPVTQAPAVQGAPPPPPPPPVSPAAPTRQGLLDEIAKGKKLKKTDTAAQEENKPKPTPAKPVQPLTAAQIAQQKRRVEFINAELTDDSKVLEDLAQDLVDADTTTLSKLKKETQKLLKKYEGFNDIRDFGLDGIQTTVARLDTARAETAQFLKDIESYRTATPTQAPTTGSNPPPPPPPPAISAIPKGVLKPKSAIDTLQTGLPKEPVKQPVKQPQKPQATAVTQEDLAKKLKPVAPQQETAPTKSASLLVFENRFNRIPVTPGKELSVLQKKTAQTILDDLNADIEHAKGVDKIQKQQLYNAMKAKFK
jgi:hypothetical protein